MKGLFPGYYPLTKVELDELWKSGIFSFDASVLLNLYRYSEPTRKAFLDIFKSLGDRLWITHQAALEYHRGRIGAIRKELGAYTSEGLKGFQEIHDKIVSPYQHPLLKPETAQKFDSLFKIIESELHEGKKNHEKLLTDDTLLNQLTVLFEDKVGDPFTPEQRADIEKQGKDRYDRKIPPGRRDKGKTAGDEYGDLFIWKQLLDKAGISQRGVIFVTDDRKDDWWSDIELELPQPPLREEIRAFAKVPFHMYAGRRFLEVEGERRGEPVKDEVIQELKASEKLRQLQDSVTVLNKHFKGLEPFVGKWRMAPTRISPEFVLTVDLNSVRKSHVPNATGTWKIIGGMYHIDWTDGWLDILQSKDDGTILKIAFAPGADRGGPPTNVQVGRREE